MNKKGFTLMETMITILVFGVIILIVYNFNLIHYKHITAINENKSFYSEVDFEVSKMYSEKPTPGETSIPTKYGDISVSIGPEVKTSYGTFSNKVEFKLKDLEKEYNIERSEYNEK